MRAATTDGLIIFGIDRVQGFFIQVWDEHSGELNFAMQQHFQTSFAEFSFENIKNNVTEAQLKEILATKTEEFGEQTFTEYFVKCFDLPLGVVNKEKALERAQMIEDSLVDFEAYREKLPYLSVSEHPHKKMVYYDYDNTAYILLDYFFFYDYTFKTEFEDEETEALEIGVAFFLNTNTGKVSNYTIWLDSLDYDDKSVTAYCCLPISEQDDDSEAIYLDELGIEYDLCRVYPELQPLYTKMSNN